MSARLIPATVLTLAVYVAAATPAWAQGAATPRAGATYRLRETSKVHSHVHLSFPASPGSPPAQDLDEMVTRSITRLVTLGTWAAASPPELEITYENLS